MDSLRRMLANISAQLAKLTPANRMLVLSVVVILAMTLFIVAQYAGRASWVELLPGAAGADTSRVRLELERANIRTDDSTGKLRVPAEDRQRALAIMGEQNLLPADKTLFFESLVASQNWMNSRQITDQNYNIALQNELAKMIAGFRGIRSASVVIDAPEPQGLGRVVRQPTATVTASTGSSQPISQETVDAIANLLAGAKAGLVADHVTVIDAGAGGRLRRVSDSESLSADAAMDRSAKMEVQVQRKMEDLLRFIPGVVVAVTAAVDVTHSTATVQTYMPEKQGSVSIQKRSSETTTTSTNGATGAATPGVTANQTADINQGSGSGTGGSESTESTNEFENHVGSRTETIIDPKGQATSVAISVGIPRSFVASLLAPAPGAAPGATPPTPPTDQQVAAKFDSDVKPMVTAAITPQLRAMLAAGRVNVKPEVLKAEVQDSISIALLPKDVEPVSSTPIQAGIGSSIIPGTGLALTPPLIEKGLLALLSVVAMGLMLAIVRKSGKPTTLPKPEELVGMPPPLETAPEVIGEADESEIAMAGIELGEDEMQAQKVLEQVNDLVAKDPQAAAKLIARWVNIEE